MLEALFTDFGGIRGPYLFCEGMSSYNEWQKVTGKGTQGEWSGEPPTGVLQINPRSRGSPVSILCVKPKMLYYRCYKDVQLQLFLLSVTSILLEVLMNQGSLCHGECWPQRKQSCIYHLKKNVTLLASSFRQLCTAGNGHPIVGILPWKLPFVMFISYAEPQFTKAMYYQQVITTLSHGHNWNISAKKNKQIAITACLAM